MIVGKYVDITYLISDVNWRIERMSLYEGSK